MEHTFLRFSLKIMVSAYTSCDLQLIRHVSINHGGGVFLYINTKKNKKIYNYIFVYLKHLHIYSFKIYYL